MSSRHTLALSLAIPGVILVVAAPFLSGGTHLVANDPTDAVQVTELVATTGGDVLAGTEAGDVWRLRDHQWTREDLDLGGYAVMALLDEPGRTPVGTSAGVYYAEPDAAPLKERVGSLLRVDRGLLAGTAGGVRLLADGIWHTPGPTASIYSLFTQRRGDDDWLHAGTVGTGVLSAPAADSDSAWQSNNQGLPADLNVFGFATTRGERLLAGTDNGLYSQSQPGQPWRSLVPELEGKRVLSLHLTPSSDPKGAEQLWIGGDNGLYSLEIAEQGDEIRALGSPRPAGSAENQPERGVSGIVSGADGLMISAGGIYEYRPTRLPGGHWIALAGAMLILIAGWLLVPTSDDPPDTAS